LIEQLKASPTPRYLVADAKLYTEENAKNLALFPFITRIPGTLAIEQQLIDQAWSIDTWQPIVEMAVQPTASDVTYSYQRLWLCHYGIEQRWLIIYSKAAEKRAEKTLEKAVAKEFSQVQKQLKKVAKKPFSSPSQASAALEEIALFWSYHRLVESTLSEKIQYAKRGKPKADTPIKSRTWHIAATVAKDEEKIEKQRRQKACFVLGTNIPENELTDREVFSGYKGQSAIEQGFSFLKDPVFFVSSLFLKKPSRIQGLLMVMTLALLVYSIAQRRSRKSLMAYGESIPNQIGQPTQKPTLRWLFQLLEGINRVAFSFEGKVCQVIEGLTHLRQKIIRLFGESVIKIYHLSLSASSP